MEHNRVGVEFLLSYCVPEMPPLELCRITNKDTLHSMRLQLLPLVLLDIHKCSTSKDSEVGDIRLALVP